MTALRRRLLLAAAISGLFLAMLDQTVVGTALPRIVAGLDGAASYSWAVTAYLVTATVSLPLYARLSDRHGRRRLLLVGMSVFLGGSALCAVAPSMNALIAARGVQGLGAGALEALPFILVADLFRGRRSAGLQGALAGLMGVAFLLGPPIGGLLTDHVGWRAVFLVNLPVGLVALAVVARVLPASLGRSEDRGLGVDARGIVLLTAAVGLLLLGASGLAPDDPRTHGHAWRFDTLGALAVGLAFGLAFVRAERRAAAPIVPPALWADRRTAALIVAGAAVTFGLYAGVLLLPRYFQQVRHVDAAASGLLMYPLLLGLLVGVNVGAAVIVRTAALRATLLGGCGLAALGALGFATFDAGSPDGQAVVAMGLLGVGMGPTLSGAQIALQRTLPAARVGGAIGALLLLRQLGGAVALAAAGTIHAGRATEAGAASATGTAVCVVALAGLTVTGAALASLRGRASLLPPAPA